jgi:glutathionylspermidine synthase
MRRISSTPRMNWQQMVRAQGVSDARWDESACYILELPEVLKLEAVTEELYRMCQAAARHVVAQDRYAEFGIPPWAAPAIEASLAAGAPSLVTRLDLRYDGSSPPKLLDCQADLPDGLVETAIAQWYWLDATRPDQDQWNSLHERLISAWRSLSGRLPEPVVHFGWSHLDSSGVDEWTAGYLADAAEQAGIRARLIPMQEIGWDGKRFVDALGAPISTCFKRYPWAWMIREPYGRLAMSTSSSTIWIEPPWKLLLSGEPLREVLWQLYPDHPNLLPADQREPVGLPSLGGGPVLLGSWVVTGEDGRGLPAGAGLRELAPDGSTRFVPHFVAR